MGKPKKTDNHISKNIIVIFCIYTLIALSSRIGLEWQFEGKTNIFSIARGLLSDTFICGCITLLIYISPSKLRYPIATILILMLCVISIANFEHIIAMNSSLPLRSLALIFDDAALEGAKHSSFYTWIYFVLCCLCIALFVLTAKKSQVLSNITFREKTFGLGVLLISALILHLWDVKFSESFWHQSNPIAENIANEWAGLKSKKEKNIENKDAKDIYTELLKSDLSGKSRYVGDKKNILLILIEGVSGHHVFTPNELELWSDNVSMPLLSKASKNQINYTHFIAPQVQTNRGEYAFLCGDQPNLSSEAAKMTIAEGILKSKNMKCLPRILNDAGYSTSYLQAADMNFMGKKKFMPLAGFENAYGTEWFSKPYFRHSWGIGDEDFFKQSIKEVKRLEETKKPWFLTLLTVGTHHNYTIPDKYKSEDLSPYGNAVLHADTQVMQFLDTLSSMNITDDTLIIISADESQGSAKDKTHLSKNWIPFVIFDKGAPPQEIHDSYSQTDFSLSIIDYLNLSDSLDTLPPGRSLFREYNSRRHTFFARHYDHVTYWYSKNNELLKCDLSYTRCENYLYDDEFFLWSPTQFALSSPDNNNKINISKYISQHNDWDFERFFDDSNTKASLEEPWLGQYYMSGNLKGKSLARTHKSINFQWNQGAPYPGFPLYNFGARWQTCIKTKKAAQLIAIMSADEGAKLYLDNELIIDGWEKSAGKKLTKTHTIKAGLHHVRMDYKAYYWSSFANLKLEIEHAKKTTQDLVYLPPLESDPSKCSP